MEANKTYQPEMTGVSAKTDCPDEGWITDENAEQKIRDKADMVGVLGSIGALILGLIVWKRQGVVVSLLYAGFFVFVSCAFASLLYGYADATRIALDRIKILKKLAAEHHDEPPVCENAENKQETEPEPEIADSVMVDPEPAGPSSPGQEIDGKAAEAEAVPAEMEKINPDMPSEAYAYDNAKRVASFQERSRHGVICPVCGKWQESENDTCFRCSCRFLFDDERQSKQSRTT